MKARPKILFLQDFLRMGGTERQAVYWTQALRNEGWVTRMLTFRQGGPLREMVPIACDAGALQKFPWGPDAWAPGLRAAIMREKPDIVVPMGKCAHYAWSRQRAAFPTVLSVSTLRTGKSLAPLYRRALLLSDLILANSQWAADHLLLPWYPEAPVKVLRNPLLKTELLEGGLPRLPSPGKPVNFITVAMLRPEKDHRFILSALALLPSRLDWQWHLVGDGQEKSSILRKAKSLGIAQRVQFHGQQNNPVPFLRNAHLALLGSRFESYPNFLLEAQAAGLPVVTTNAGGAKETLLDNQSGYVIRDRSPQNFSSRILQALDPENYPKLSPLARQNASSQEPEKVITQLSGTLAALLPRPVCCK